ncbi:MAG: ribbon-helix-helix domain-containing protein [Candidatus Brocadia sinica]|nr:ribbon-helix-helix domain-containing protein [Candidatus Brocadia sinica]
MVREANKLFNLLLPFKQYQELRDLGTKTNRPIAEIVREGIDLVLKTKTGNPTTAKE